MTTAVHYQAHCIWCGRDAGAAARKTGRCSRCGATLLLELDLEPVRSSHDREAARPERKPRRRPLGEALQI